jgi:hypothetical protein
MFTDVSDERTAFVLKVDNEGTNIVAYLLKARNEPEKQLLLGNARTQ